MHRQAPSIYIVTQDLNGRNVHHTHYWVQLEIGVWISLIRHHQGNG